MIKSKKINIAIGIFAAILLAFQLLILFFAAPREYYLIYDWVFYGINYVIVFILILIWIPNRYLRWLQWILALALFTASTTILFSIGEVNLVLSESEDSKQELILKEYPQMNFETVRLKRQNFLFGKKAAVLTGSSTYKAIEEKTFKIEWVSNDIAITTYQANEDSRLFQNFFSYRDSDYISYQNTAVSLAGIWHEQGNSDNYFQYDQGEIIYAKDGDLYYYRHEDTEQRGIFSIIVNGGASKPSFTVVLNQDAEYGDDNLIKEGGTITISPITLEPVHGQTYEQTQN